MNPISQIFAALPNRDLPIRQIEEQITFAQAEAFYHLAVAKDLRLAKLKQSVDGRGLQRVFLSANLSGFDSRVGSLDASVLEQDFFLDGGPKRRAERKARIRNGVLILNNNDAGSPEARAAYAEFYRDCDATCFIAWDWDNHHWLDLSTFLAAHSDLYAPAHHENLYLLSRYNWHLAGPVYCSSVQWPRQFLTESLPRILLAERSDQPLGMHIPYGQFSFRMRVITTLNQHYPDIGFSARSFHARTPEDRLREWCSHKTHWIAPVLNDVPIRIFDALVTGGIPIVPESMRLLPPVCSISRHHIVFYGPGDIVNPQALVAQANTLFDQGGRDGMVERHRYALKHHHGEISVLHMLDHAAELLGLTRT